MPLPLSLTLTLTSVALPGDKELLNVLSSPVFISREVIYGTASAIMRVDIGTGLACDGG